MFFEASYPIDSGLYALYRALDALPCVAAVDCVPAEDDSSGEPTLEVTIAPAHCPRGTVPKRVVETVYDRDAPWVRGIADVSAPTPGHLRVLVR